MAAWVPHPRTRRVYTRCCPSPTLLRVGDGSARALDSLTRRSPTPVIPTATRRSPGGIQPRFEAPPLPAARSLGRPRGAGSVGMTTCQAGDPVSHPGPLLAGYVGHGDPTLRLRGTDTRRYGGAAPRCCRCATPGGGARIARQSETSSVFPRPFLRFYRLLSP